MYFKILLISDPFCHFLSQHSDGSLYFTNNSQLLRKNFRKKFLYFCKNIWKKTFFVNTTASPITTINRALYPLVTITIHYLEKLSNCYINWIHFVSPINTWTVFIPCSSTDSAEKLLQRVEKCLTMCKEQSLVPKKQKSGQNAEHCKKEALEKKFEQHFMNALQKNKSLQTSSSVFVERIEKAKKTKFELELTKFIDCFLDGHCSYDSNLVYFKTKSL